MGFRFDEAEFLERAASRLHQSVPAEAGDASLRALRSDDDLNPHLPPAGAGPSPRAAAVLVPVVAREPQLTVLLTVRTDHLASHAGQVAFPGGKIDQGETPVAAALREAWEETGLEGAFISPRGFLDVYETRTGFRVVPVVGLVSPGFTLAPAAGEVADVFEVPLAFLMDEANHQRHARTWQGIERQFYAMPYGDRYIWGATAGMLKNLYDRMYAG
jgi:8-oxo-dGTP pyrophosphatase MutT (NUDIX family)